MMKNETKKYVAGSLERLLSVREIEAMDSDNPEAYKGEFDVFLSEETKRIIESYSGKSKAEILFKALSMAFESTKNIME